MAFHNAYVLLKKLLPSWNISLQEYKRQRVVALNEPQKTLQEKMEKKTNSRKTASLCRTKRLEVEGVSKVNVENVVGDLSSGHYLLENVRKRPIECFLC
jgi:hypothetical protein